MYPAQCLESSGGTSPLARPRTLARDDAGGLTVMGRARGRRLLDDRAAAEWAGAHDGLRGSRGGDRAGGRRGGEEGRYWRDWSSDVCSSDLSAGDKCIRHNVLSQVAGRRPWLVRGRSRVMTPAVSR